MGLHFDVASESSGALYEIDLVTNEGRTTFTCTCAAGEKEQLCKHRLALLAGNFAGTMNATQEQKNEFARLVQSSSIAEWMDEISASEIAVELAKKKLAAQKKVLGHRLSRGF